MMLSSFSFTGLHLLETETLASNGNCRNKRLFKIYLMLHNYQGIYDSWVSRLLGLLFLVTLVLFLVVTQTKTILSCVLDFYNRVL